MKRNRMTKLICAMLSLLLLCGCAGEQGAGSTSPAAEPDGQVTYRVTVENALGTPYTTGVIVQFLQDGAPAGMQAVNSEGVAEKVLPSGEYTVELVFTGDDDGYHYEKTGLTVSADETELTVVMNSMPGGESRTLYAQGEESTVYYVTEGSTYVPLTSGQRNYVLFAPNRAGTYEFKVVGNAAAIGYYGAPHFVQAESAAEVTDNGFQISISAGMIGTDSSATTVVVIGMDPEADAQGCVLTVERVGEAAWTLEDEPWQIYQTTAELSKYVLPAGAQIQEFDLTAPTDTYPLVYNEADGFYHLNSADGPLVLMRLAKDPKYLASFKTMLDSTGMVKYVFDENGDFVEKTDYSQCLLEYIPYADEDTGLYPLTEDLKHILLERGGYEGWWDIDSHGYIFYNEAGEPVPGINADIAWLFMCCYITGA